MHLSMLCPTSPHQREVGIRAGIWRITLTPPMGHLILPYTILHGIRIPFIYTAKNQWWSPDQGKGIPGAIYIWPRSLTPRGGELDGKVVKSPTPLWWWEVGHNIDKSKKRVSLSAQLQFLWHWLLTGGTVISVSLIAVVPTVLEKSVFTNISM